MRPRRDFPWQLDQARQCARCLHDGHATAASEGVAAFERDDKIEALVQDPRKRMRGIESEGAQDREQLVLEVVPHPGLLLGSPLGAPYEADLVAFELGDEHLIENPVLILHQPVRDLGDPFEYLVRRHVFRTRLHRARSDLFLQARHADLEELIEVGSRYAEEAQPLEQRRRRVLGLFEDAPVELQQAELAIDIELWLLERFGGLKFGNAHGKRICEKYNVSKMLQNNYDNSMTFPPRADQQGGNA